MGAQILNAKSTRRIARATGLPIVRAWGHGGYKHGFVTAGHLHGWFDIKSGEVHISVRKPVHYSSCNELFAGGAPPLTVAEAVAKVNALSMPPL